MGCCCSDNPLDAPSKIIPDPTDHTPHIFLFSAIPQTAHWLICNKKEEKWLFLREDHIVQDERDAYTLENYIRDDKGHGETLAQCFMNSHRIGQEKEWDQRGEEFVSTLRWKITRTGTLNITKTGDTVEMGVKMKGETLAVFQTTKKGIDEKPVSVKSKIKRVYYTMAISDVPIHVNTSDAKRKSREWTAPDHFKLTKKAKAMVLTTEQKSMIPAACALLLGWSIAQFFNPDNYVAGLEQTAIKFGLQNIHEEEDIFVQRKSSTFSRSIRQGINPRQTHASQRRGRNGSGMRRSLLRNAARQ